VHVTDDHNQPLVSPFWPWKDMVLQLLEEVKSLHPLGRLARPEEIAAGIVFLLSDDSSLMTGSELVIDGGYSCQ
jgi:NAD(P)-dependent dehydrogenase (short-subunit alcohol dehydrogenase family)